MLNLILVSLLTGVLFGAMDALINANALARRLGAVYAPVAKAEINAPVGVVIDLVYGVVITLVFVQFASALPGASGLAKGLALGMGMWFFRVVMSVVTTWMTHRVPPALLGYQLVTGLGEMLVLGAVVGTLVRM